MVGVLPDRPLDAASPRPKSTIGARPGIETFVHGHLRSDCVRVTYLGGLAPVGFCVNLSSKVSKELIADDAERDG